MGEKKEADARDLGVQFSDSKKDVAEMGRALKAEVRERVSTARQKIVGDSKQWVKERPAKGDRLMRTGSTIERIWRYAICALPPLGGIGVQSCCESPSGDGS